MQPPEYQQLATIHRVSKEISRSRVLFAVWHYRFQELHPSETVKQTNRACYGTMKKSLGITARVDDKCRKKIFAKLLPLGWSAEDGRNERPLL